MVLRGDFGTSFVYNKPVTDLLGERFWRTLAIAATCHLLATLIGVGLGIIGAVYQHRWGDRIASTIAFLGMTIPRFFMALVILYWLAFVVGYQYVGAISSREYIFAADVVRQAVGHAEARLADHLRRRLRRARLQHARDAREPARRAAPALYRGGARQGRCPATRSC